MIWSGVFKTNKSKSLIASQHFCVYLFVYFMTACQLSIMNVMIIQILDTEPWTSFHLTQLLNLPHIVV